MNALQIVESIFKDNKFKVIIPNTTIPEEIILLLLKDTKTSKYLKDEWGIDDEYKECMKRLIKHIKEE